MDVIRAARVRERMIEDRIIETPLMVRGREARNASSPPANS
jgi:hypothetical protein